MEYKQISCADEVIKELKKGWHVVSAVTKGSYNEPIYILSRENPENSWQWKAGYEQCQKDIADKLKD